MRVVVITAAYPSRTEPERALFVETLNRALVKSEGSGPIALSVVAPRVHQDDDPRESRHGIDVRRFAYPGRGRRLKEIARPSVSTLAAYCASGMAALLDEVRSRSADAILCHWTLPCGPIAASASALLRVPYALVAHGSDVNRYGQRGLLACASRWAISRARCVAAVSDDLRRTIEKGGLEEGSKQQRPVKVLPMGVDGSLFRLPESPACARREARRELSVSEGAALLLFVGDLVREKGVLELLEAISSLRGRGFPLEAALAGSGELEPMARGRAAELGLKVLGRVSQEKLLTWHRASDLLVLPSHSEGAPVSVMEALSSGLPVVASRLGGLSELVDHGVTGWLVPPSNSGALADQIERLLRDPASLQRARERLAQPGRDFSVERRAVEYRRLLDEVVHGV